MGIRVVGLTGGIASGKSTVSAMLREMDVPVVDADLLAREAVAPGTDALEAITRQFGARVLTAEGTLDRAALGAIVFADPTARTRLNAIVHPIITERSRDQLEALARQGHDIAVYDAALILENGLGGAMDALIVVTVPPAIQLERLMGRDGLSALVAQQRIDAQMPLSEKVARADYVIDNAGSRDATRRQLAAVWDQIRARFDGGGT